MRPLPTLILTFGQSARLQALICLIVCIHNPASILAVCSYSLSAALTPWWLNRKTTSTFSSLERRWSSRTFRYGYLVTTSPQLSNLPSAAPSCVRSPTSGIFDSHGVTGGVYKTRERIHRSILICDYLLFQFHVVELQTTIRTETLFLWFAWPHDFASLCLCHCSTCVAQVIRGMMIWRHPHLPPGYPWQSP